MHPKYVYASNPSFSSTQLDVAIKHIDYHTSQFGYSKPNVEFRKGYIERLKEAGIEDQSQDIVMYVDWASMHPLSHGQQSLPCCRSVC